MCQAWVIALKITIIRQEKIFYAYFIVVETKVLSTKFLPKLTFFLILREGEEHIYPSVHCDLPDPIGSPFAPTFRNVNDSPNCNALLQSSFEADICKPFFKIFLILLIHRMKTSPGNTEEGILQKRDTKLTFSEKTFENHLYPKIAILDAH